MCLEHLLGGLPHLLAAAPGADLGRHGPVFGDDCFGLVVLDGAAVGVADDVGGGAGHDGPEPLGEVGGHDAQGAEVVLAAFDDLDVVDPGELGIDLAGGVGGTHECGA